MNNAKTHIRFDWAIKRLLRNKANFVVLEGFLSELLFDNIKIKIILEGESNKEDKDDKFNRVDILVENKNGELILIEVQNDREYDYFQRMNYGASKVTVEYIHEGEKYEKLKRVIAISIVYFELGQGKDYIYTGKTDFIGLHAKDKLQLSEKQKELYGLTEVSNVFSTYYLIKVNNFNDKAKDTLDEWIYFLKNSEIKKSFKAKGLKEAREILARDKMTPKARKIYERFLENLRYEASRVETLKVDAEIKVREDERETFAKKMIIKGEQVDKIIEYTELSREQIEKLIKELKNRG